MGRKPSDDPGIPVSLRINDELQKQLDHAARLLQMSTAEVMRLAMRIGLEHFKRIDYDLAKQIVDTVAATGKQNIVTFPQDQFTSSMGAEEPKAYGSSKNKS